MREGEGEKERERGKVCVCVCVNLPVKRANAMLAGTGDEPIKRLSSFHSIHLNDTHTHTHTQTTQ